MVSTNYIPSLDGIRAVSIALVFLSHAGVSDKIPGGFGVTVFFFLSGYLITTLLTKEWDKFGSIAMRAFYVRRVLRLGPPLIITLALSLTLVALGWAQGQWDTGTILSQVLFYFNYYSLYGDAHTVDGLGILWSLAVEEHFYLVWPTIFVLLARNYLNSGHLIALLVVVLLWRFVRYFVFADPEWTIYISTDTRIDSILFGCLLALLKWRHMADALFPGGRVGRYAVLFCAIGLILASFLIRDEAFRSTFRYSLQGLALMPLFYYAVARPEDPFFRPLNWTPVRWIGIWSYNIYLIHYVIIEALAYNRIGTFGSPLFLLLAASLSIGISALIFSTVEKPFRALRKKEHREPSPTH